VCLQGFLDGIIEPYFEQINPIFPIFSRELFLKNMEMNYSAGSGSDVDIASVLAFNNVTLQSLSAKSRMIRHDRDQPFIAGMDAELLKPFLANSRRAFAQTEKLLKPRLINVQALVSFVSGSPPLFFPLSP
jgi:hypothetical protein